MMTEAKWQVLAEFTRERESDHDLQMIAELMSVVRKLDLPLTFLERVQRVLERVISKALKTHEEQAVKRAITLRVKAKPELLDRQTQASWGFFCIEKETAPDRQTVEVFLYQEETHQ